MKWLLKSLWQDPIPKVWLSLQITKSPIKCEIDWIHLTSTNRSLNSGDDIAGIVHSFGSNVEKTHEFRIGDRVAAFHPMMTPHGAFAEYAVSPQHTVLKIPDGISFEGHSNFIYPPDQL
jgi:NADPH:quinone reductase-like Zn-dependent oxidoreductase